MKGVDYIADWTEFNSIKTISDFVHALNVQVGWWSKPDGTIMSADERATTCIALIHSEISEALEGIRKDAMDDHLPKRKAAEVELADAMIRIMDLASAYGFNLGEAMKEKLIFNANRQDHKPESRTAPGGKKF